MRVGQVTHLYRPAIGGIENYVHRLNRFLRGNGHDVRTFTTDLSLKNPDSPHEREEDAVYCETNVAPMRNPFSIQLYREVRKRDLDVYHLHSPYFLTSLEAAHALSDREPSVMTVHGTLTNESPVVRALRAMYKPFSNYVFREVDHVFVQGDSERARIEARYDVDPAAVSVVPNGIDTAEFDVEDAVVDRFESDYGLREGVPTVLFVSRLISEKNPDVFVEAVSDGLADVTLDAVLVGGGEAEYAERVRSMADGRVRFLSNLEFSEVKAAYASADAFVFLGTWEGLPTVLLEAMNAGLPVVTTSVGEIPNYLEDGKSGVFVGSPPDADDVADGIRRFLDDPEEARRVGERNRAYVRENHDWDDVAVLMEEKYAEVAES